MKLRRTSEIESEDFQIGDVISFTLTTGEEVEAMAVEKAGDRTVFCLVDCLKEEQKMNRTSTNEGGWHKAGLRKKLNMKILKSFPEDLVSRMKPFWNGDLLRIPTEREIFGENIFGEIESGDTKQWEPMKEKRNRIAFQGKNGGWEWYWLLNANPDSSANFAFVYYSGNASYYYAGSSLGVRPVFQI